MADITVTTLSDTIDAADGVTSLREALALANEDPATADTITFDPGLFGGTLFLTRGQLEITTDGVTVDGDIDGSGAPDIEISADSAEGLDDAASRVFFISDGADTTIAAALNGLVIRDGNAPGLFPNGMGGGIYVGRGEALTLTSATVSGNSAGTSGGGIFGAGDVAFTLTNATVSGNSASYGGGIFGANDVAITLINATVSGNSAGEYGGGIYGFDDNPITLINSTVTGNSAGRNGGGISNWGSQGVTTLANSIVAGNAAGRATTGDGDDLFGSYYAPSNLVFTGGNIIGSAPGHFASVTGAPTTLIDGAGRAALETVFAAVANDPNTGVLSGVLADNGGPVQTVALRAVATNPALDAGDDSLDAAADARGLARVDQTNVANNGANTSDLGAYELQDVVQPVSLSLVVTTLDDVVDPFDGVTSLREALALANGPANGADALGDGLPDTITFDPGLSGGTVVLAGGQQLAITTDGVTLDGDIDGDGAADITISGDTSGRVFRIDDGSAATTISAALNGLVIRDGNAVGDSGGGIYVGAADALTLTNATVSGNSADDDGGGIFGDDDSAVTLTNSTLSSNSARFGGGILSGNNAAITLVNSTVSGNSAVGEGGGILGSNNAAITLTNATVSGNSAGGSGGGILGFSSAAITVSNTTVSGNSAGYFGGGIFGGVNGAITLTNTTVSGNSAGGNGGGIYGAFNNRITLANATVTGNSAGNGGGGIYNFGSQGVTTLTNAIVAGNAAGYFGDDLLSASNYSGHLVFTGSNIFGSAPANFAMTTGAPTAQIDGTSRADLETVFADVDLVDPDGAGGNDPFFAGVLALTGGPVQTVALRPGGIAHNAGDDGALPADAHDLDQDGNVAEPLPVDARGLPRSFGSSNDLGAFEIQLGQIADLNGDFHTDVLWRENTGTVALWLMDGVNVLANTGIATLPNYWHIVDANGDFDGDGRSDILWQDDAGVVVLWTMDGPSVLSNTAVAVPIPDHWHIQDTGDFTGDGRADVLWRESGGRVVLWEMNGATVVSNRFVADVATTSRIEDTADFTGDGMNDILWRDDDGTVRIWEMDGATVVSDTVVATLPDHWQFADTGDFNGDATYDLLWRDTAGTVVMWEMAGGGIIGNTAIGTVPGDWFVADTGDYTGDLNHDILWRDGAGTTVLWEMDGPTTVDNTAVNTIPTHWQIVA
jgi:predicted outer membrane repeat protein